MTELVKLLVLDVETTGIDPDKDAVVEIAGAVIDLRRGAVTETFDELVDPGRPIPPEAMGVHHILDRYVAGKPPLGEVLAREILRYEPFLVVAHNLDFDARFLGLEGRDGICTWRCANHLWPDAPSYSNQTLRYYLKLFREPEVKAMPPHSARADVWTTAHILLRMLQEKTVIELMDLTKAPILLRTVRFGKHRGEEWSRVPRDYLRWILSKPDGEFDRDVTHTARYYS